MIVEDKVVTVSFSGLAVGGGTVGSIVDSESPLFGMRGFIRDAVPGDVASVAIIKQHSRYFEGNLKEVITPSTHRREAPCPYASECGGCDLQYVADNAQQDLKLDLLKSSMTVKKLNADLVEPLVAGATYNYRRRVTFQFNTNGEIGFFRRQTHEVVEIQKCLQVHPLLNVALEKISAWNFKGCTGKIVLETDSKKVVALFHFADRISGAQRTALGMWLASLELPFRIEECDVTTWETGDASLELEFSSDLPPLKLDAGSFTQVNSEINQKLVQKIVEIAEQKKVTSCWDLYAGAGNFSFPLAAKSVAIVAVESDARLTQAGEKYSQAHSLPVHFKTVAVEKFLQGTNDAKPELIIADPPRDGLKRCIQELPTDIPLLLISCHLPSFLRDTQDLIAQGRTLEAIYPFDMFPLTHYLELLSVWK
jgi:23S rRNA (uracil1939-C5)-methyltransferase